jgi:Origin recognition complex (ORC) subunit 5 C-terminus
MKDVSFRSICYGSFCDTLIQSLQDYTCNIKEYIHLGRLLWPKYIEPVRRHNIDNTIRLTTRKLDLSTSLTASGRIALFQRTILELLDRRIQPLLRHSLDRGLFVFSLDSPTIVHQDRRIATEHDDLFHQKSESESRPCKRPFLIKYLLLAAYICQINRADKDKQLFSIQRNGKRTRSNADVVEDSAFGSTGQHYVQPQQQPTIKSLRPRTFPFERLLSVFVSIVSLNARSTNNDKVDSDFDESLNNLGTGQFNELLITLREVGVLHEIQADGSALRMSQVNYWCSLTSDEANVISRSVNFPLERYIVN